MNIRHRITPPPPKTFHMQQMSSTDATYHTAQDLIYSLHNPEPVRTLVKLRHGNKEAFNTLADIIRKATPPAVLQRVPVREVGRKKLQEMNQEGTQMKRTPQSNSFTNVEPLRVTILEAYLDELQPVNQAKKIQPIRSQHLTVTPKIENLPKIIFGKIKAYKPVPLPHVIPKG